MYLLTSEEIRLLDELSIHRYSIPASRLMQNAGGQVYRIIKSHYSPLKKKKILIFCGPGNNGGDGLVVARYLRRAGAQVIVYSSNSTHPPLKLRGGERGSYSPDLIIDALFGTGLSRPITGFYREMIHWINRQKVKKVSVDIPSGLNTDSGKPMGISVKADRTVTFGFPKRGFFVPRANLFIGKLHITPIGLSPKAIRKLNPMTHLITSENIAPLLKERPKNSHKGDFGHVYTVACSLGKIGAGIMTAHTALRAGAGLSTLILPEGVLQKIDPKALEIMYEPIGKKGEEYFIKNHLEQVLSLIKKARVVAIGPGLGGHSQTVQFVHCFIKEYRGPLVIDADGLNAVSQNPKILQKRSELTLLTPHPGEMGRLIGKTSDYVQNHRLEVSTSFAKKYGVYLLLKGYRSILATPQGDAWINPTGNPAMASAGQGDALTGIFAGLLSEHVSYPEGALLFAPFLHGLVGDLLAKTKRIVLATDIACHLDLGFRFLEKNQNLLKTEFY